MKLLTKHAALLLVLVFMAPALMAGYPMPGSDKQAPVLCTGCVGTNFNGEKNASKPTWPYSAPISKHLGRLVDSHSTKDIQAAYGGASGTVRANKIRLAQGPNPSRVYVKMGRGIGAYSLSTFFTSTLARGMQSVTTVGDVRGSRTKFNAPNEELTVWDAYIYAENYGSSWPSVGLDDKQDVLHDFDVDDRGYVYSAYTVWGWGIHFDSGETGGALLPLIKSTVDSSSVITVVRAGSSYYVAVADGATPVHKVYDVTTAMSPTLIATRNYGIRSWAHNETAGRIAIIDDQNQIRVYTNAAFAQGGAPLFGPLGAGSGRAFSDVTFDDAGNLFASEESNAFTARLHRFTPNGSGYAQSSHDLGESFSAKAILPNSQLLSAAGGYVAVAGGGLRGTDVMIMKVESSGVRKLDLKNYFNKYYHAAPLGYANPDSSQSYVVSPYGLKLVKHNNKMYLMYNAHGIGDVYELEAGDSVGASMRSNTFGTTNPNSKATEAGPFPGDVVKFVATSSNPSVSYQVNWNFDNTDSGRNSAQTATGAETSHQFVGYTTTGQITAPKKVVATVVNDASLTDTVTVNLKVPVARIGVSGTSAAITAPGTPLTLLLGDKFTDASDGSVESHVANWSRDGGAATKQLPSATFDAGAIGAHTVSLVSSYGRYDSSLNLETSAYSPSVSNVSYVVRPFVFTVNAAKSGTNAVFTGTSRVTTNSQVLTATTWTVTWTLKSGPTVVQTETATLALGTIPTFTVPMTSVPTGSEVTLDASVPPSSLVGAAEYATYSQKMSLSKPDPKVTREGCGNVGTPCTLTASSVTSASLDGWVFNWTLTKDGTVVANGAGNPYKPNIAASGSYTIDVTAVKGIFEGAASQVAWTAQGALCSPPPRAEDQIAISYSCPGGACETGEAVTFRSSLIGYTKQDCDTFSWTFGDNSAAKVGTSVTHAYTSNNTYTARLTVSNTSGSSPTVLTLTVTVGGTSNPDPDPPPTQTCSRATNTSITYVGRDGCGPGTPCKVGESVLFTAYKNNGDQLSLSCDTANWTWGDSTTSSGRSVRHTYTTASTYTVTLVVTNSAGNSSPVSVTVPVVAGSNGGGTCAGSPTEDNLTLTYRGGESSCTQGNGALCRRGESIQFNVTTFGYTFQACDKFAWTFGDGGTSALKNPTHAYTGSAGSYTASVRVYNDTNPTGITLTKVVPFDNAPALPQPRITISAPSSVAKGVAVTFTAVSDIPARNWSWNFGDNTPVDNSQANVVGTTSTVTHIFNKLSPANQPFSVSVSARNADDTTDRSMNIALASVAVSETPVYRFLLPAVIHAGGQGGSAWRTDVQVYYSAPSPSAEPLNMTAEFEGTSTPLSINQSTFIYEDFMRRIVPNRDAQGPVIITTQSKYKPQIWTRTYNVDASGRTYGQFIPAVSLDSTTGSATEGSAEPVKYYLAGLRENTRYRTNLGFINPNMTDVIANVVVYDDLRIPLTQFTVTMGAFQLVTVNGLGTKVPNLPNRPVTLEISVPAGKWLVAYASFIDGVSNDPAYIPAVSELELASPDYATGITPGVGHIGTWRSDVTIYNPDSSAVKVDLEYYDAVGLKRAEAKDIVIGAGQVKTYEDLLKVNGLWSAAPPDGLGMLRLRTTTPVAKYPLTFSRTYNDKGSGGTFGQGILGFAAARANVKPGKPGIIPAVRSDANYKTNIGLTNTTGNPVNVLVRLLDPNTGATARELPVSLSAYQSVVGVFDFGGLATGTFKVEITGGEGAVWAFASIINQGNDPEYVPAISVQ